MWMPLWLVALVLIAPAGAEDSILGNFRKAQRLLDQAFGGTDVESEALHEGMALLQDVGSFVSRVMRAGGYAALFNEHGQIDYHLSSDDMEAVQAYMDEKAFVLGDVLPLVTMPIEELLESLRGDGTSIPAFHRWRLVSTLRMSWWTALMPDTSLWAVPFFGALGTVARRLRREGSYEEDAYREALWAGAANTSLNLEVLATPVVSWAFSRRVAFRRACACLAGADSQVMVEAAERHFKSLEQHELGTILEHAAEWPLFDLLHGLAMRPHTLLPRPDLDAMPMQAEVAVPPADWDGEHKQRLSPTEALDLYRVLHIVAHLCNAFNISWWVSHGTLIGALRDGGLSLHADDCEVDISEADVEIFQSTRMRRALARNGCEVSYDPRGRCFKVWPAGSARAPPVEDQLLDQSWWLPQQRVGSPSLDVYIVEQSAQRERTRYYISNEEFHCNANVCSQRWLEDELESFAEVPFGQTRVRVPVGAAAYLSRVYGADWSTTVRPHRWAAEQGRGFEAHDVAHLSVRTAGPAGPLLEPVLP